MDAATARASWAHLGMADALHSVLQASSRTDHLLRQLCQPGSTSLPLPYLWRYPPRASAARPLPQRRRAPSTPAALQHPRHQAPSRTRDRARSPLHRRNSRVVGATTAATDSQPLASAGSSARCPDCHAPAWTSPACATRSTLSPPRPAPQAARLATRNGRASCLARRRQGVSVPVVQFGQARVQRAQLQRGRAGGWRREPLPSLGHSRLKGPG